MSTTEKTRAFLQTAELLSVSPHDLCEAFAVSDTALRRNLRAEGQSFTVLLLAERQRRCMESLAGDTGTNLDDLAEHCGYADRQSLCRAFKNWHGVTITAWRNREAA